ncbi:Plakophilin-4 [Liparis tanakae]|uniref:Plakophilin-4 n=1 Tax=Liparis tanakae TaxID=230148 RepID=A0A4Z2FXE0_9TELE|nr:Plakophilin-4 [Liparis tanakae]
MCPESRSVHVAPSDDLIGLHSCQEAAAAYETRPLHPSDSEVVHRGCPYEELTYDCFVRMPHRCNIDEEVEAFFFSFPLPQLPAAPPLVPIIRYGAAPRGSAEAAGAAGAEGRAGRAKGGAERAAHFPSVMKIPVENAPRRFVTVLGDTTEAPWRCSALDGVSHLQLYCMAAVFNQKTGRNLFDVSSWIQKWKLGGQRVSGRALRRMSSLPPRSQSPGCGAVSPSRVSLRTSQGSAYDSPVLSEPRPLAAVFPATPPSGPSPSSPAAGGLMLGGGRLGSTLSLGEGRGLTGAPLRPGMTAVPQHYGATLPRQSQPLAYGDDPYGPRGALPRPDSLIGLHSSYAGHTGQGPPELGATLSPDCHMTPVFDERSFLSPLFLSPAHDAQGSLYRANTGTGPLPRAASLCGSLAYQRGGYGLSPAALYVDEPVFSRRHSGLGERAATRTPSIESIHKDPREFAWRDPELLEVIHMLQHHFPSVQANAAAYLQHLCYGDNRVKLEVRRRRPFKRPSAPSRLQSVLSSRV